MDLLAQLTALESSGLIEPHYEASEIRFSFRHALVQEAAYHSLVKRDRQRLHLAAGETLELLNPNQLDSPELAPLLAEHFAQAGERARAAHYYLLAGRAAAGAFANLEAIDHFTHVIELDGAGAPRDGILDAYLRRGRALELNAQDAEALANYEALEAWAGGDPQARLAALTARGTIYVKPSIHFDPEQGLAVNEQALALARETGHPEAEARAWWNLLQLYLGQSRLDEALKAGERALALARAHGSRELVGYVLTDLNKGYGLAGRLAESVAAEDEARQIWRALGALNMLADNLASGAVGHVVTGNFERALALADEALAVSRQIGNVWNESYSRFLVDLVYFERGEIGRALDVSAAARDLSEQAGFAYGRSQANFDRVLILAELGDLAQARTIVRQMQAAADAEAGYSGAWPLAEGMLAWLHLRAGQLDAARASLAQVHLPSSEAELQQWFTPAYALTGILRCEMALAEGDASAGLAAAAAVSDYFRSIGVKLFLPDMLHLKGQALLAAGQPAAAQAAWREARTEAEALGSRRMGWRILAALARLETGEAARALWREANELIEFIAAHILDQRLRTSFLERAEVREVVTRAAATM